ncbi:hypothetical protein RAZWK3B_13669 [Roseobacter sp. AzwK-3b]|uniref:YcbK family protein n=1 Tax=Roseobacter sp. AzwK-3b TaxID=351016 RepID=UPI00015694BB|nr:DUF882 domain-containing protein [Roseobacter sp. AzwK-3b]EDM71273.1 hypothetical protein RAZWK3B_13669 [Roseobacter sp. AzwK-3b]
MSQTNLSRRSLLVSALACLGPGAAHGFIASSDGQSLLGTSGRPLIDLQKQAPGLGTPPRDHVTAEPAPTPEPAPPAPLPADHVQVSMRNAHTAEELLVRFHPVNGRLVPEHPDTLDHFLRDWRRNRVIPIDPFVTGSLALVVREATRLGWSGTVQINSGYRTRETNADLRRKGIGAARNSLHLTGQAIDFVLPGVPPRRIGALARQLLPGGIGTYASFVHIDSGRRRSWQG